MKNLNNNFLNSIKNKSVLTLSKCFKIYLKNDTILALTDYHRAVKFLNDPDDVIYYPLGFVDTVFQSNLNFTINNLDLTLLIDNNLIDNNFLEKNLFNDAKVVFFEFNFLLKPYNFNEVNILNDGNLGRIKKINDQKYECEFLGKSNKLKQTITTKLNPNCLNNFCDANCKLNINDYKYSFKITEILNNKKQIKLPNIFEENFFKYGYIKFLNGNLKNEKYKIFSSNNDIIILSNSLVDLYNIDDDFEIFRGCANNPEDCKKYNNYINYNGFPNIPGNTFLTSGKL